MRRQRSTLVILIVCLLVPGHAHALVDYLCGEITVGTNPALLLAIPVGTPTASISTLYSGAGQIGGDRCQR